MMAYNDSKAESERRPSAESIAIYNAVWNYCGCTREEAQHEKRKILANFEELDRSYRLMYEATLLDNDWGDRQSENTD